MDQMSISSNLRDPDACLTARGLDQAIAVGEYLESFPNLEMLFVSPTLRTLQTARPLVERLGGREVRPEVWLDLHEEGGVFNGTRDDHLQNKTCDKIVHGLKIDEFSEHLGSIPVVKGVSGNSNGWWRGGFESPCDAEVRGLELMVKFWEISDFLIKDKKLLNPTVVVVSHGLLMDRISRNFLGRTTSRDNTPFFTHNCGINIFHLYPNTRAVAVACLNSNLHIPPSLRSGHTVGTKFRCGSDFTAK